MPYRGDWGFGIMYTVDECEEGAQLRSKQGWLRIRFYKWFQMWCLYQGPIYKI